MGKHRSSSNALAGRAWRLLRLALMWAQKGGLLKCRLMAELRLMPKYLKGLHNESNKGMIRYGERELSFDETPVIHLRMSRPRSLRFKIPCIEPEVEEFDYDFGGASGGDYDDVRHGSCGAWGSFMERNVEDHGESSECCEDEGIDVKAEKFIAKFYEQMKLQRQVSYQQRLNAIQAL